MKRLTLLAGAAVVYFAAAYSAWAESPRKWAEQNSDDLLSLYYHFHQHPELSFDEKETSKRLASEWRKNGFQVAENIGGYGVVAVLENGTGKHLMLRTDMDALPVTEQTGLKYASQVVVKTKEGIETGVMHACGHDIHMTNLVGVARYLAANKDKWQGKLMLIGQPAEERGAGAKAMLDDGLFKRFSQPDFGVALHCDSSLAAGKIAYRQGYALANVDSVDITLIGRGGHGAYPHTTIDPIVIAARLVLDLQTVVSREINPIEPAVITVGSIQGGTKHNIIPNTCHLQLTVRSYSDEVRERLKNAIIRKAKAAAEAAAAEEPRIEFTEGTPALLNSDELTQNVMPTVKKVLGKENVVNTDPSMGGEDFSRYGRAGVPILMFWLGTVDEHRLAGYERFNNPPPSLHSPLYYPDAKESLITGISVMSTIALELLSKESERHRDRR